MVTETKCAGHLSGSARFPDARFFAQLEVFQNFRKFVASLGQESARHGAAHHLGGRISVDMLGPLVPAQDDALQVLADDGVVRTLHDRAENRADSKACFRSVMSRPVQTQCVYSPAESAMGRKSNSAQNSDPSLRRTDSSSCLDSSPGNRPAGVRSGGDPGWSRTGKKARPIFKSPGDSRSSARTPDSQIRVRVAHAHRQRS